LGITDNNEKYYICNICSNNNDESIQVVISVSVSESVLFIADISVIGISVNLLIGAPLVNNANQCLYQVAETATWSACKPKFDCGISLPQDGSSANAIEKRKRQQFLFDEIESGILSEEDNNILIGAPLIYVHFSSLSPLK